MTKDRRSTFDYGFGGLFGLRSPHDLLKKLRHDALRLERNPLDSYAAFDFFVTANCLIDWSWPSETRRQLNAERQMDLLPRICWHLADSAKHYLLDVKHSGVESTTVHRGAFVADAFSPNAFQVGELLVELEPAEAGELGQTTIEVRKLAPMVVEYWNRRIGA